MTIRILSILLFLLSYQLSAKDITLNRDISEPQNITPQTEVFEDHLGTSAISEILNKKFKPLNDDFMLVPFSDNALWMRISLKNEDTTGRDWILQFSNELSEDLQLYRFDSTKSTYTLVSTWDINTSKKRYFKGQEPYFEFTPAKEEVVYLRLKNQRGIRGSLYVFPASIYPNVLLDYQSERQFIFGLLSFRLLLVLTLGIFVIKDKGFRAYSLFILIKTFGYWGLINVMNPDFINSVEIGNKINYLFYAATPFGVITFSLMVLPLDKLPGWIKTGFYILLALTVLSQVMVWVSYNWHYVFMGLWVVLVTSLFSILTFFCTAYRKLPIQPLYSIPFMLGIGGYILMNFQVLTGIKIPLALLLAFILFMSEILVFIFFLGRIFRQTEAMSLIADQQLENERIQSEKLLELDNLKTSFFTNISHELKTPLTLISGPLSELKKRHPQEKLLDMMQGNVLRLRELVSQILDIQKLDSGKEPPQIIKADLARQVKLQVLSFDSLALTKNIKLSLTQSMENFEAFFDNDKLNKILSNLISNAIKYSPENSEVLVNADFDLRPKKINLSVSDTGFGISTKDQEHIFDKFYQVNSNNHQGSGVGLSLVKDLVELLKGKIKVYSKEGKGTTFLVELPVDEKTWKDFIREDTIPDEEFQIPEKATLIKPLKQVPVVRNEEKKLILLVEDNPEMQEYLNEILLADYDIIQAFDGKEGLQKASQEVPDLIISDLMMPSMDGFEFCREIRADVATSHVPIIMLTAKSDKASKLEGYELGVDHYLTKPFDSEELSVVIKNCLSTRAALRKAFTEVTPPEPTEKEPDTNKWEKAFMDQLKQYLEVNFKDSNLSVPHISRAMGISESQFRRKLKSISSYSPNEYLRKFRLHKAAHLLSKKKVTVSEVAFQVGFESLSYFSKAFQSEFKVLPSDYQ